MDMSNSVPVFLVIRSRIIFFPPCKSVLLPPPPPRKVLLDNGCLLKLVLGLQNPVIEKGAVRTEMSEMYRKLLRP